MSKTLFNTFDTVSSKAWKQKIQSDLKGANYNDTLVWNSNDGIDVKPFYHADDFDQLPNVSPTKASQFKIGERIMATNPNNANNDALDAINNGAEHIGFYIVDSRIHLETLFNNIDFKVVTVTIFCNFLSPKFAKRLKLWFSNYKATTKAALKFKNCIQLQTDPIGQLAKTGNWYNNFNTDIVKTAKIVKITKQLTINTSIYQNAGANNVQQLAYAIAHANEYLEHVKPKKLHITFQVAVGSNYFFEIAKLRALRKLWPTLANAHTINTHCSISALPTKRNKTIYDYNVNMLRSTTECMSAILGGANTIYNLPYDTVFKTPNTFGNRISRNQLLILKNESYFNKVNNPADGSYYIETLTTQLAQKALELFKDIEKNGGFLKQLFNGKIQQKISESAQKEQSDFDTKKLVLLGTNKHENTAENLKESLEINPFLKQNKRKTLIEPIIQKRLSEELEINRLKNEKTIL